MSRKAPFAQLTLAGALVALAIELRVNIRDLVLEVLNCVIDWHRLVIGKLVYGYLSERQE